MEHKLDCMIQARLTFFHLDQCEGAGMHLQSRGPEITGWSMEASTDLQAAPCAAFARRDVRQRAAFGVSAGAVALEAGCGRHLPAPQTAQSGSRSIHLQQDHIAAVL